MCKRNRNDIQTEIIKQGKNTNTERGNDDFATYMNTEHKLSMIEMKFAFFSVAILRLWARGQYVGLNLPRAERETERAGSFTTMNNWLHRDYIGDVGQVGLSLKSSFNFDFAFEFRIRVIM